MIYTVVQLPVPYRLDLTTERLDTYSILLYQTITVSEMFFREILIGNLRDGDDRFIRPEINTPDEFLSLWTAIGAYRNNARN